MTKEQAERQAEKVIETVVNMIAERQYDKLSGITNLSGLSSEDVKELAEGFLERNDLNGIDR
ncbi:MAG: hypothetical protein Q4E74_01165 [Ruminococcus sp.]|nr:hypothetical protein [Ruminococcus sp.]